MADKFDKFTERARKVLTLAQEEAQRFNHNYIGTEHLLLGLVREGDGVAARVLGNMGVQLPKVRSAVEFIIGRGETMIIGEIGLTPRAKKVIELAVDEARRLNHHYIGTEHLLLGLVREGEGIAAGVLESLGVNLEKVRAQVMQVVIAVLVLPEPEQDANQDSVHGRARVRSDRRGPQQQARTTRGQVDGDRPGDADPLPAHQEQPRPHRRAGRRQDRHRRRAGPAHRQRRCAGAAPEQAPDRPRYRRSGRRHEIPRRVRRASEEDRRRGQRDRVSILFIDELHTLVGAGAAEGAVDAANILKPALSRGELQTIGATTLDEYRKYIERDAALERRFQPVQVDEPSVDETILILTGVRHLYEEHHKLKISDEALKAAANFAARYVTDRFMPDKAIDLIDEASSRVRMYRSAAPPSLKEALAGLQSLPA